MEQTRQAYVSPQIEVIQMENEGCVMAASAGVIDMPNSDWGQSSKMGSSRGYNSAASSDLEDMINDILTVE